MARPTDRGEAKSAVLSMRVTPSLKAGLETEAKIHGRTLAAECEERLVRSLARTEKATSPETLALLEEIEDTIAQIERGTGARWHEDVATWSAVFEMLGKGPILTRIPASMSKHEAEVDGHLSEVGRIHKERELAFARLEGAGVIVPAGIERMLDGEAVIEQLRQQMAALDLADFQRAKADAEIKRLEGLERQHRIAASAANRAVDGLAEAVEEGRKCYKRVFPSQIVAFILGRLDMRKSLSSLAAVVGSSDGMPFDAAVRAASIQVQRDYHDPTPA